MSKIPSPRSASLTQIAELAGVSIMTASRALRGVGSVRPETRKRVIEAAADLDGSSNNRVLFHKRVAAGKASDHRLKLLIPQFRIHKTLPAKELNDRFSNALENVLEQSSGTLVRTYFSKFDDLLDTVQNKRFHAVIIRDSLPSKWFQALNKVGIVISAVSNDFIPGCDCVLLNESRAATTIYNELVKRKHEHVAWFGINDSNYIKILENVDHLRDSLGQIHVVRYAAWNSIASMGPSTRHHTTLYLDRDHDKDSLEKIIAQGVDRLLKRKKRPTAIVTPTEIMAVTLIKILNERGLSVPGDCSVVCYGRTSISKNHRPTLAGIRTNFDEMAQTVPELVSRRLADPNARPISVALEADFESGNSLAKAG